MSQPAQLIPSPDDGSFAIHVDCDPLWVYANEYGLNLDAQDLIYRQALPAMLALLEEFRIKATFFAIGQELDNPSFVDFLRDAVEKGHRIGNHSLRHSPRFWKFDAAAKRAEIEETHARLSDSVSTALSGFRAPGYANDPALYDVLQELGYRYEGSTLPGPATRMMAAIFMLNGNRSEEKSFSPLRNLFASSTMKRRPNSPIWQIPISVIPFLRLPIHTTFIYQFGSAYGRLGLDMLSRMKGHHVYLFHAIDMLDYPDIAQFEGKVIAMRWSFEDRRRLIASILTKIAPMTCLTEDLVANA